MKRNQKGFSALQVLLILVVVGLVGFVGWHVWHQNTKTSTAPKVPQTSTKPGASNKNVKPPAPKYGIIKGQASYPSEGLPADEEICAQNINVSSAAPICVNVGKAPTTNYTYTLELPVADYYVYAQTAKLPNYKAYYDEFSKCGNSVNCPAAGHKQYIKVTVTAGAVVQNVDPGDWYANVTQ